MQQGMKCQCQHPLSWMVFSYYKNLQIYLKSQELDYKHPYTHHLDCTIVNTLLYLLLMYLINPLYSLMC